ncbi:MAG: ABC transporter permease [Clostridia bacterium]|nr:ABC transporter permease [Clostridia bacterium]
MYVIKNAFRCISRAKGRNVLIGLVVLLLSVSSCIGLSIKEANRTLKKQYADDMEITATVNPKDMRKNRNISLDKLTELSNSEFVKEFNYSSSVYFAAGDGIEPLDVAGSFKQNKDFKDKYGDVKNGETRTTTETQTESSESSTGSENSEFPEKPEGGFPTGGGQSGNKTFITNNNFFFNMASMNDFTVTAYNSDTSLPEYISSLGVITSSDENLNCVISKSLAEENELEIGSTFTLKNPDNEEEVYAFTVAGVFDSSETDESQDTSSNASFTDNYIYISSAAMEKILLSSAETNPETTEDSEETAKALTANYKGTFIFANLDNYNKFSESLGDDYTLVSSDVSNYEQSISQLETLGKYATYFLIVIFIIGAFVLIIINLFSIRNRKYEIGVLTAIGMKKWKVATQFVIELFVVTFAALIIGSTIGSVASVPVTNSLLVTINSEEKTESETSKQPGDFPATDGNISGDVSGKMTPPGGFGGDFKQMIGDFEGNVNNYIISISSATDMTVILQMILVGMGLTLVSSAAAVTFVMRYEPLKILNNRD